MIDLFLTNNKNVFMDVKAVPSVSMDADLLWLKLGFGNPKAKEKWE